MPVLIILLNPLPVILRDIISFTRSFMINTRPLVGCLENADWKVKQFRVIPRIALSRLVYSLSIQCPKWMCLAGSTNVGCFCALSLPPSADSAKINIISTNDKQDEQDVLKQPEANTDFFVIFFGSELSVIVNVTSVIVKALLTQISLCLLSHFRIRIIMLTCPDNKSARSHQPKSCVPAKSHKSQWCEVNTKFYFNWNLRSLSVCSC